MVHSVCTLKLADREIQGSVRWSDQILQSLNSQNHRPHRPLSVNDYTQLALIHTVVLTNVYKNNLVTGLFKINLINNPILFDLILVGLGFIRIQAILAILSFLDREASAHQYLLLGFIPDIKRFFILYHSMSGDFLLHTIASSRVTVFCLLTQHGSLLHKKNTSRHDDHT